MMMIHDGLLGEGRTCALSRLEDKVFIVFWVGSAGIIGFVDSWRLKNLVCFV